jgi:hypothetical protein
MDIIKKNTEILIVVSKEVGLEINVEKAKYVVIPSPESKSNSGHTISKQIV